jgi:kinesin family member 5
MFGIVLRSILCAIAKNDIWILKAVKCICVDISVLLLPFSGNKVGKSLLIDDGSLPWIVKNANNEAAPIRRHIELALCHLAQHGIHPATPLFIARAHTILYAVSLDLLFFAEVNSNDIINEGALWELVRISRDCSREDIRKLAYRTLTSSPTLQAEMRRLGIKL